MTEVEIKQTSATPPESTTLWALENLPPFPAVATQLLRLVSDEDVQLTEVGKLIATDPVFAADVLQIANSALFGLRFQVKTIPHAIFVLGLERVKGISLTRALGDYLSPALRIEALRRCWQHSLAGALLAEKLARACGIDADFAYTAGLLRDIGRLALLVKYPRPYANMLAVSLENGLDLRDTEQELFDIDHCQAGYWLTEKMQMPPELREVVARHHDAPNGGPFGLVHTVRAADLMSDALGFGALNLPHPPPFESVLDELPGTVRAHLATEPEEIRAEISDRLQSLNCSPK